MVEAIYLCPAGPSEACTWEGKADDITLHFYNYHSDLILTTNIFPINVSTSTVQHKLLILDSKVYLIQTKVFGSPYKLMLKVRYLGTPKQAFSFVYTVNIRVGNYAFKWFQDVNCQVIYTNNVGVEVNLQMIKMICGNVNLEHVICVLNINTRQNCDNSLLDVDTVKINTRNRIHNEKLSPQLTRNDSLSIRHKRSALARSNSDEKPFPGNLKNRNSFLQNYFYDEISLNNNSVDSSSVYSLHLEDSLFSNPELECTTCCTEMCPPIYLCMNGHSVCGACKNEKCRSCDQDILDIRNTDLEDISVKKQHSCKYAMHGCGERGNCSEIRKHETNCRFCVYRCCLCPQEGKFSEIKTHFKLLHSSIKVYETLRNKFPRNTSFAIISSEYGIFYCTSAQVNGNIEWNVTFCGPNDRWFSCNLKIKGKREDLTYSFKRNVNIYSLTLSHADLKTAGIKDKYAVLEICQ